MFSNMFGGGRSRDQNPLLLLGAIIIAPIAASMIQLGISRQREYAADKTGAHVTHDPDALADALEKLERGVQMRPMPDTPTQQSVSALYIVKPFRGGGGMSNLFSTHPPLEERIKRLRNMAVGR
jgi:heat shock protein HtpX